MPGYSKEILLSLAEDKYLCTACKLILKNPMRTAGGLKYCTSCIHDITSQSSTHNDEGAASNIAAEDIEIFPDTSISLELRRLDAQCVNVGCEWKGLFREFEKHSMSCALTPPCPSEYITCTNRGCGQKVQKESLEEHLEEKCLMRLVHCVHCKGGVVWKDLIDQRYTTAEGCHCNKKDGSCKYLVGVNKMREHGGKCSDVTPELMILYDASRKLDSSVPMIPRDIIPDKVLERTIHQLQTDVALLKRQVEELKHDIKRPHTDDKTANDALPYSKCETNTGCLADYEKSRRYEGPW